MTTLFVLITGVILGLVVGLIVGYKRGNPTFRLTRQLTVTRLRE